MNNTVETVRRIRRIKKDAEAQIAAAIAPILEGIEMQTDMCPQGVIVYFAEVTEMGDDHQRFVVSSIEVDLGRI